MFCAICTGPITAETARMMDGYTICDACDEEHPRMGRYSFGERDVARAPRWLVDGNRRSPHKGRR